MPTAVRTIAGNCRLRRCSLPTPRCLLLPVGHIVPCGKLHRHGAVRAALPRTWWAAAAATAATATAAARRMPKT